MVEGDSQLGRCPPHRNKLQVVGVRLSWLRRLSSTLEQRQDAPFFLLLKPWKAWAVFS